MNNANTYNGRCGRRVVILIIIAAVASVLSVTAQRRITPVEPSAATTGSAREKNVEVDPKANLVEQKDATGNVIYVDTITGKEWVDTTAVKTKAKMKYPLLEAVTVGINFFDPAMRIFGQHYGGIDAWAELSLHNRYKPIFEFGMGSCNDTPDGMNFTFKTKMSPYFRIGMNYNIFYNNSPDYQFCVGLRYGFTPYSYEVTGVTVDEGYWNDPSQFSIPSQSTTAGFLEIVAGVKVKIYKHFSMGWNVKYHTLLHEGKSTYGEPMYIPGYGKRGNALTGSFSIIYTIPLGKPSTDSDNNSTKQ